MNSWSEADRPKLASNVDNKCSQSCARFGRLKVRQNETADIERSLIQIRSGTRFNDVIKMALPERAKNDKMI